VDVQRASVDEGPSILRPLRDAELPVDGLWDHLHTAFVARVDGYVVGCALEVHADGAVLRSVAVMPYRTAAESDAG
jgi:hypothetical protein